MTEPLLGRLFSLQLEHNVRGKVKVTTAEAVSVTGDSAALGATVASHGNTVVQVVVAVRLASAPDYTGAVMLLCDPVGGNLYSAASPQLTGGTAYLARAFALDSSGGTTTGQEVAFSTNLVPFVTTTAASAVAGDSATCGGEVTASTSSVTARGVCYSAVNNPPTLADAHTTDGSGLGVFASSLSGLAHGQLYFVRAYATNSAGDGYGSTLQFTTLAAPAVATQDPVTNIGQTGATAGGSVAAADAAVPVTAYGVCYSASEALPSLSNNSAFTNAGSGSPATFVSVLAGLDAGSSYFVRAYATNAVDTSYGSAVQFNTLDTPASVTTGAVSGLTTGGATVAASFTAGSTTVSQSGLCYVAGTGTPVFTDAVVSNGPNTSPFTGSLSGLGDATTYTVRAFVQDASGLVYGASVQFQTLPAAAVVTTGAVSSVGGSTAALSGSASTGNSAITESGFYLGAAVDPGPADGIFANTGTLPSLAASLAGLAEGTVYHVRAYAINAAGTALGLDVEFVTDSLPSVTSVSATNLTHESVTLSGNVTSDNGATVTERGFAWSEDGGAVNNQAATAAGTGAFTVDLTGLTQNALHSATAYAINAVGTGTGGPLSFTTQVLAPALTIASSQVTDWTAVLTGNITNGVVAAERGFRYVPSTDSGNPVASWSQAVWPGAAGAGIFASLVQDFLPATPYTVVAYATASGVTYYSSSVAFTTSAVQTISGVDVSVTQEKWDRFTLHANVTGGWPQDRTILYDSSSTDPYFEYGQVVVLPSGVGPFEQVLDPGAGGELYYVGAKANNAVSSEVTAPVVGFQTSYITVGSASAVSNSAADVSYFVYSGISASAIQSRGIVYAKTPAPVVTGSNSSDAGTFTEGSSFSGPSTLSLAGLAPDTLYYARSYATVETIAGVVDVYSPGSVTFTTLPAAPTFGNLSVSGVYVPTNMYATATYTGTVTGSGFFYRPTSNPTFTQLASASPGLNIQATTAPTVLNDSTIYYYKAYLVTDQGTFESNQKAFVLSSDSQDPPAWT